jgi:hypothetical protein
VCLFFYLNKSFFVSFYALAARFFTEVEKASLRSELQEKKNCEEFSRKIPMEYRFHRSFSDKNSVYDSVFGRVYHKYVPKKTII